jgi:hypothetical protein
LPNAEAEESVFICGVFLGATAFFFLGAIMPSIRMNAEYR